MLRICTVEEAGSIVDSTASLTAAASDAAAAATSSAAAGGGGAAATAAAAGCGTILASATLPEACLAETTLASLLSSSASFSVSFSVSFSTLRPRADATTVAIPPLWGVERGPVAAGLLLMGRARMEFGDLQVEKRETRHRPWSWKVRKGESAAAVVTRNVRDRSSHLLTGSFEFACSGQHRNVIEVHGIPGMLRL